MKQTITYTKISMIFIVIVLFSANVFAFAVSSQYYDNNPLYLKPGESMDTFFTLQNNAGTEDVTIQARITYGADVIEFIDPNPDNIYIVPVGVRTKVNFRITIPADATIGEKIPITMIFSTLTINDEGPVSIGGNIGKGYNVIVGERPPDLQEEVPQEEPETNLLWLYILIGIIVLIIIIFSMKKKKK